MQTGLSRAEVLGAFDLLLGRRPHDEAETARALRLTSQRDLVHHLFATDEFRDRYQMLVPAHHPGRAPTTGGRPPPVYLGDRVLCWTRRGRRIFLIPNDIDLTPHILSDGYWEEHVEQAMLRQLHPGDAVIDIGSNVGYHTVNLADAVTPGGKVYAFEPNPQLVRLLEATISTNNLRDIVELHRNAVSDCTGTLTLALPPDRFGSGNVVPTGADQSYDERYPIRHSVPSVTLDAVLGERVGQVQLIHMDIEGAEPSALRGAQTLIERSPALKIVTEWSPGMMAAHDADVPACVSWLAGMGFRFWLIGSGAELRPLARSELLNLPLSDLLLSRTDPG